MNAIFYDKKPVVRVDVAPSTIEPGPDEVRLRVAYSGICGTDLGILHGKMDWRIQEPHVLGHEVSGVVECVGSRVTSVQPGDRVTVMPLVSCGECPACHAGHAHICHQLRFLGIDSPGGMQPRWTVPVHTIVPLPDGLPLRRAALIEPIAVACHDVRLGGVKPGDFCVVQGGGPIGALIGLVAQRHGARVLCTEVSPFRVQTLRELGLEAINVRDCDVVKEVEERTGGAGADIVFEVTGHPSGAATMTKLARTRGTIVLVGIYGEAPKVDLFRFFWRELRLVGARVYEREDFDAAAVLAADDTLPLDALITRSYPITAAHEAFAEAMQGGTVMKVLIDCGGDR